MRPKQQLFKLLNIFSSYFARKPGNFRVENEKKPLSIEWNLTCNFLLPHKENKKLNESGYRKFYSVFAVKLS